MLLSAGKGAKGPRVYDWTRVAIRPLREPGKGHWLLVRRSIAQPEELADYVCFGPADTTLEDLVRVAGTRWAIEECFQEAKGQSLPSRRRGWGWTSMKCGNGKAGTGTSPWPCWPMPIWRWSGNRPTPASTTKRGRVRVGLNPDTVDGSRGAPAAVPLDLAAQIHGEIGTEVVPMEAAPSSQSPPLPLQTPPIKSAAVVLGTNLKSVGFVYLHRPCCRAAPNELTVAGLSSKIRSVL